ncbi:MAG: hypothetical protein FD149_595 [Rhodospirillaceae bacterium]|nr:MAG: hypothetical protein FD149_595 [Rhodospirillaceae bacterium]
MALESATQGCSVAVWRDGTVLAHREAIATRAQAEILMPMVQAVRVEAGISFAEVEMFAVTVGPGSFTGVRVGLATARALGLAAARPVAGVTTSEAVAWAVGTKSREEHLVVVLLDSFRSDVYVQPFRLTVQGPVPLGPVRALVPSALTDFLADLPAPAVLAGNVRPVGVLPATIAGIAEETHPQAWAVAAVAAAREEMGQRRTPEPLYLRPPDVTGPSSRSEGTPQGTPRCF